MSDGRGTSNRVPAIEMGQLEEAIDWSTTTAWEGEVNTNQLRLEVDALVESEIEVGAALIGVGEPCATPPATMAHGSTPLPTVHARRLQSGGWRVEYWALSGNVLVVGRYKHDADALLHAGAYAHVHGCQLEVDE